MKTIVVGDVHNEFGMLNALINKHKNEIDLILACGDFGFWPNVSWAAPMASIRNGNVSICWCDGNHEDHWRLAERESDEIVPKVFYMPRGQILKLRDGRNVLFMGGAESIDRHIRVLGETWFPEEILKPKDVMRVPQDARIDIVISHTCPKELEEVMLPYNKTKYGDPSTEALSYILQKFKPKLWFFGHWHIFKRIYLHDTGTMFYALSMTGRSNWWKFLPEKGHEFDEIK